MTRDSLRRAASAAPQPQETAEQRLTRERDGALRQLADLKAAVRVYLAAEAAVERADNDRDTPGGMMRLSVALGVLRAADEALRSRVPAKGGVST